jgi:hypothetical protein
MALDGHRRIDDDVTDSDIWHVWASEKPASNLHASRRAIDLDTRTLTFGLCDFEDTT